MYFDDKAKDWDNDPAKLERAQILANELIQFFKKEKTLNAFEFGCGTGLVSYYLRDFFKTITLADNSEGMINVLKEKIKKENLSNMNPLLTDLLVDNPNIEKQDVIYNLMTLHHILDLDKMIGIFNSMTTLGGYLCIADLVKEDGSFHAHHQNFDGHNGFDKNELTLLLAKNGYEIELYKIFFEIEKKSENETKKYPIFLIIGKKINEI